MTATFSTHIYSSWSDHWLESLPRYRDPQGCSGTQITADVSRRVATLRFVCTVEKNEKTPEARTMHGHLVPAELCQLFLIAINDCDLDSFLFPLSLQSMFCAR